MCEGRYEEAAQHWEAARARVLRPRLDSGLNAPRTREMGRARSRLPPSVGAYGRLKKDTKIPKSGRFSSFDPNRFRHLRRTPTCTSGGT